MSTRGTSPVGGRFLTLDAMRGVAALMVCFSHFQESEGGWYPRFAYLAVDLFFILSGFVIARAYDARLATSMSFLEFFQLRFIRLFPMLAIGSLLGAFAPGAAGPVERALSVLMNSAALPTLPLHHGQSLTPHNVALWSLIFELWVANLAFGLLHRFLRGPILGVIILVGALGLGWTIHSAGWLNVGWAWGAHDLAYGFFRVTWGFFAGVAIERLHRRFKPPRVPPILILAATALSLCLPLGENALVRRVELALPLIAFPLLVWLGTTVRERRPSVGLMLGEASYALYAIHHPLLALAGPIFVAHGFKMLPFADQVMAQIAVAGLLSVLSWYLAKEVDEPAQAALKALRRRSLHQPKQLEQV